MQNHAGYRVAMEAGGVLALYSHSLTRASWVTMDTRDSKEVRAYLTASTPESKAVHGIVRNTNNDGGNPPQHLRRHGWGYGRRLSGSPRTAPVRFDVVLEYGKQLHGFDLDVSGYVLLRHDRSFPANSWAVIQSVRDTYSLLVLYQGPAQDGNMLQVKPNLLVDGTGGGIVSTHVPRGWE